MIRVLAALALLVSAAGSQAQTPAVKKELVAMVNGWDQSLLDHSTNDWYTVTISALSCWPARQRPTSSTRAVPTPSEGHVSLVSGGYFPEENEAIGTGRTVTPAEPSRRNS